MGLMVMGRTQWAEVTRTEEDSVLDTPTIETQSLRLLVVKTKNN